MAEKRAGLISPDQTPYHAMFRMNPDEFEIRHQALLQQATAQRERNRYGW
ncbi:MAG: hypothetical protein AB7S77_05330 [Desulfatirhabdiaceae bacterium]